MSTEKEEESRDSGERKERRKRKRKRDQTETLEAKVDGERKNQAEEAEEEEEEEDQEEGEKRRKEEKEETPSFGQDDSKGPQGREAWGGRGNGRGAGQCADGTCTLGRWHRERGRCDDDIPPGERNGPIAAEIEPTVGRG